MTIVARCSNGDYFHTSCFAHLKMSKIWRDFQAQISTNCRWCGESLLLYHPFCADIIKEKTRISDEDARNTICRWCGDLLLLDDFDESNKS